MRFRLLVLPLTCVLAAGCVDTSGPGYQETSPQVVQSQNTRVGTIVSVRDVIVRKNNQGDQVAGAIVGGVLGGIVGHQFGAGSGRDVMTAAGAAGGAIAGSKIAGQPQTYRSREWTVQLNRGGTIAVIQNSGDLWVGQRVRVIYSGNSARLQPL
jgi:outer membrane lipoprotein SlyB